MGIVNAVLLTSKIAPRWVTDAGSISTWGRIEDTLSVGEMDDPVLIDSIGAEYLSVRAQPMLSYVYEVPDETGVVGGVDYREGDTLTDPALRVIELQFSHAPDGRFVAKPTLSSKLEELARRNGKRIERLIAEGGGSSPVSAQPADTGSGIEAGKLDARQVTSWTWTTEDDLEVLWAEPDDEEGWQRYTIDEPLRLTEMHLECDFEDADGFQVADGPTRFRLLINDVAPVSIPLLGSIPIDVEVASNQTTATVPIFGGTILSKGDNVSVSVVSAGNHINGAVSLFGSRII